MSKRVKKSVIAEDLSGFKNLVKAFERFSRKLASEDENRKGSNTAEEEIRENGIGISGGGAESGRVGFKRINGLFDGGALLVDIVPVFGTPWDVAGIKAAVRGGSDVTGAAVGVGARVKTSGIRATGISVVESERAKEFESWSAVGAFGGADKLERLVTGSAERDAVRIEI